MNFNTRIDVEVKKLSKDPEDEVGIYRKFDGKRSFYAFIRGPDDSPFEHGYFKLFVHLSPEYPFKPPVVKFMTPVYHPNISSKTGAICLDILKDRWTAAMNLDTCLRSIQSLLTDAVPEDPQDYEVAVVYCNDNEKYLKTAREWTEKYATKEYISESEKLVGAASLPWKAHW
ncbi:uncharacterized protein [Blastocystis hominis]|uniref:UBC core domain-containing protein n=1 Tax=Blastocystis hominis TaxID=12968 RepID=D8M4C8_BLAHO|nr:uncharacterized protein [Blastocystis hominis]CBK22917.2 unnamed protein product [Blastocystis hominis]|eukprot:XP_012896965.1 uncharacterized protein [Blastocystis hominis]